MFFSPSSQLQRRFKHVFCFFSKRSARHCKEKGDMPREEWHCKWAVRNMELVWFVIIEFKATGIITSCSRWNARPKPKVSSCIGHFLRFLKFITRGGKCNRGSKLSWPRSQWTDKHLSLTGRPLDPALIGHHPIQIPYCSSLIFHSFLVDVCT